MEEAASAGQKPGTIVAVNPGALWSRPGRAPYRWSGSILGKKIPAPELVDILKLAPGEVLG